MLELRRVRGLGALVLSLSTVVGAQAPEDAEAILTGQHDVENDQVEASGLAGTIHRAAIFRDRDPVPPLLEELHHHGADLAIVLHDQDVL